MGSLALSQQVPLTSLAFSPELNAVCMLDWSKLVGPFTLLPLLKLMERTCAFPVNPFTLLKQIERTCAFPGVPYTPAEAGWLKAAPLGARGCYSYSHSRS